LRAKYPFLARNLKNPIFAHFPLQEFHFCPLSGLEKDAQRLSGKVE
jgi:hypothetical protein